MLQVQLIISDSSDIGSELKNKIDLEYTKQLNKYINRNAGRSNIIPREGETISFMENYKDSQGNEETFANTFRITKVIHNITEQVLILSVRLI